MHKQAAKLGGGSIGTPVLGLYAGDSGARVAVPAALVEENTTMLLFHSANVSNITVQLGLSSYQHLRVLPVSPFGGSFTLSGQCNLMC